MPFYVQTLNNIAQEGLDRLTHHGGLINHPDHAPDALLLRSATLAQQDVAETVQVIARAGAGTNNIPVTDMTTRGIPVLNTPGANANAVKDLVLMALMNHCRHTQAAWAALQGLALDHDHGQDIIENMKKQFVGSEIQSKTLGIIGLGAVGVHVANAAVAMGMHVIGYDPFIQLRYSWMLSAEVTHCTSLEQMYRDVDYLSLHVPLNTHTHHLIDAQQLARMTPHTVLMNFSRGPVVDEQAVCQALHQHQLQHYITDFPNADLLQQEGVTCYPHLGASTREAEQCCAIMAADQMCHYLQEGSLINAVNFPNMQLGPLTHPRLCVVNDNVPNMVSHITDIVAKANINVLSMNNASLNDVAYTVLDLDKPLPAKARQSLARSQGIIRTRMLIPHPTEENNHANTSTATPTV